MDNERNPPFLQCTQSEPNESHFYSREETAPLFAPFPVKKIPREAIKTERNMYTRGEKGGETGRTRST